MFNLILQTAVAPNCFSTSSYLQGDIQARELILNLVPQEPLDQLCTALTNTTGTSQLFFKDAATLGFPDFISNPFTYLPGQNTIVTFLISSLTIEQIDVLINIQVADYVVKIEKAADITGSLNSLSYMKIDVSSCWSNLIFSFNPLHDEEFIQFLLTPNDCVIPGSARLAPFLTIKTNSTEMTLAEFQAGEEEGDYKLPYVHSQVLKATLTCQNIVDEAEKEQCFAVVQFVSESQNYDFGIKLVYETNGIDTNIIQGANVYQAHGSGDCAKDTQLTSYIYPDGFFIFHDPFDQFESCLIGHDAVSVVLTGGITVNGERVEYGGPIEINTYRKKQYYNMNIDLSNEINKSMGFYPQYMQFNEESLIAGSFYNQAVEVKQCFYEVIMTVINDNEIELSFRSHYFEICQNISEEFELMFISQNFDIAYSQKFNIELDPLNPIAMTNFELDIDVKKLIKDNNIAEFTVRGASFYFASSHINYAMDVTFLIIQFSYFAVYFTGGLLVVLIILKKQNTVD